MDWHRACRRNRCRCQRAGASLIECPSFEAEHRPPAVPDSLVPTPTSYRSPVADRFDCLSSIRPPGAFYSVISL
ncbi:unnamed protein product [Soboliphyme baturini]|uniref:Uncharacterized protein n=1 Tax=Soboliphyme baturini TaxID=241478 RepID=A0A183IYY3_9BILA|nr:unnamed protein product [Soboliphyme baturini]